MKSEPPPAAVPPPVVPPVASPPKAMDGPTKNRSSYVTESAAPERQRYERPSLFGLLAFVGVLVVAVGLFVAGQRKSVEVHARLKQPSPLQTESMPTPQETEAERDERWKKQVAKAQATHGVWSPGDLHDDVTLTFKWNKAGFDNIMKVDFRVSNHTDSAIKDITIRCTHFAKSGTQIDRSTKTTPAV